MRIVVILMAVVILLSLHVAARADVFNLGSGLTNLETVTIGNSGNAADTRYVNPGYGSVSYTYNIGKYEVTAAQYCDFLNHKAQSDPHELYCTYMWDAYGCKIQRVGTDGNYSYSVAADYANRPVNYVSYWSALRFSNWLNNGQGDGDTETGAYTLNGYNGNDGRTIQRNGDWLWAITGEDEWYKAAYYKGGGTNAGYWRYPTQSNTAPGQDMSDISGNNANYCTIPYAYPIDSGNYTTTIVGEFQNSDSAYGTFDQGGNVWEWNEAVPHTYDGYRGVRGGSYYYDDNLLQASDRYCSSPLLEYSRIGFRVVQAVPEPSSLLTLLTGALMVCGYVKQAKNTRA